MHLLGCGHLRLLFPLPKTHSPSWQSALALMLQLRELDAEDPVRFDLALFGFGVQGVMSGRGALQTHRIHARKRAVNAASFARSCAPLPKVTMHRSMAAHRSMRPLGSGTGTPVRAVGFVFTPV